MIFHLSISKECLKYDLKYYQKSDKSYVWSAMNVNTYTIFFFGTIDFSWL